MINAIDHDTLNALKQMVEDGLLPKTQKEQGKVFGVRESTMNGWVNNDKFPEYAKVIMRLLVDRNGLQETVQDFERNKRTAIPVFSGDKILIVKIEPLESAVYLSDTQGHVLAECTEADSASLILDSIS